AECGDPGGHESRICRSQVLRSPSPLDQKTRVGRLEEHVGGADKAAKPGDVVWVIEVQTDGPFAAIVLQEEDRPLRAEGSPTYGPIRLVGQPAGGSTLMTSA